MSYFVEYFENNSFVRPGAYSAIDVTGGLPQPPPGTLTPLIIGDSKGGVPGIVLTFPSGEVAKAVLLAGDGLTAVRRAFQPFQNGDVRGAYLVRFIRLGTPTQATLTLSDTSPAAAVVIKSADYGLYTNGIRITVGPSTRLGYGYVFDLIQDATGFNPPAVIPADNLGRFGISLQYTGTGTACALSITRTQLTTVCTGATSDNLTVNFSTYDTLQKVVDYINSTGKYVAFVSAIKPDDASNEQDLLTSLPILAPMTLLYTGAGSAATAVIAATSTDTVLTTACTGAVGDNLSLNFSAYDNLDQLAHAITGVNAVVSSGVYTYTGAVYTVVVAKGYAGLPPSNLALASSASILSTPRKMLGYFTTTAHIQAVVDYCNTQLSSYVTADFARDGSGNISATVGATPLATVGPVYLAGGTNATINSTAWTNAFELAKRCDAQLIVPVTSDPFIHAAAKAHAKLMCDPQSRQERIAIVGGAGGETKQEAINRARALGSSSYDGSFVQLVWPGLKVIEVSTGVAIQDPPYISAAQKAGASAGLGAGFSCTNKYFNAAGLETNVSPADTVDLISGGVCCFENVVIGPQTGVRCVKDITCWLADGNFIEHLLGTKLAAIMVGKRVRDACEPLIGVPNDKAFEVRLRNVVASTLDLLQKQGLLVASDTRPAWRDIVIIRDTVTARITFSASVTTEVDFIFIKAFLDVFRRDV